MRICIITSSFSVYSNQGTAFIRWFMISKLEGISEESNAGAVMNLLQTFVLLNQTTQATKKLKRKRLEVQVKDLLEAVALNALIAIGELLVWTIRYRKIAKKGAPGLKRFKGPFWGAYVRRGLFTLGNLRFKINRVKLMLGTQIKKEIIFRTVLALSCLYLRTISKYKVPVTYIRSDDVTEGFWITSWGGLIFGILR